MKMIIIIKIMDFYRYEYCTTRSVYDLYLVLFCGKNRMNRSWEYSDGAENDQGGLFDCNDDGCTGSSDCNLTDEEDREDDVPAINPQPHQVADVVASLGSIFPE